MKFKKQTGFTIVELLIVVVVIAILAAITIVSYNGIQNRAQLSAAQSAVSSGSKKIELYKVQNSSYPATLVDAGLVASDYTYRTYNSGKDSCVSSTVGGKSYQVINGQPMQYGDCIKIAVDVWARTSATLTPGIPTEPPTVSGLHNGTLNWGYAATAPVVDGPSDYFIAAYRAYLNPPETGTYTISEVTDDGAMVYVDGNPIIDGWTASSGVKVSGTINLVAGQRVPIVYLAKEVAGNFTISLRWAYGAQTETVIPLAAFNS